MYVKRLRTISIDLALYKYFYYYYYCSFYNLKGADVIVNDYGANLAPIWIAYVIQNNATTATHK